MTKVNTPKRPKKRKKKTGAPEVKILITALSLFATLGGWAGMAASSTAVVESPPLVVQQVSPPAYDLRPVSRPQVNSAAVPTLRKAVRPAPITKTRSSS